MGLAISQNVSQRLNTTQNVQNTKLLKTFGDIYPDPIPLRHVTFKFALISTIPPGLKKDISFMQGEDIKV